MIFIIFFFRIIYLSFIYFLWIVLMEWMYTVYYLKKCRTGINLHAHRWWCVILLHQWRVSQNNLVLSTGLIMWIGHCKKIQKLMFWGLALCQRESRNCGFCVVYIQNYYSRNCNTVQIWSWFSQYLSSVGNRYPAIYVILYAATS